MPHDSSATEWWYVNSHLETESGRKLSLFASFFRIILEINEDTGTPRYAHALNWAISDPESGKYYAESRVDRCAPEFGLKRLDRGEWKTDPLLRQALREILERGQVPHPDRLIEGPIVVEQKNSRWITVETDSVNSRTGVINWRFSTMRTTSDVS